MASTPASISSSLPASEQGVKQWTDSELISLAERMQHDLDIKTRWERRFSLRNIVMLHPRLVRRRQAEKCLWLGRSCSARRSETPLPIASMQRAQK